MRCRADIGASAGRIGEHDRVMVHGLDHVDYLSRLDAAIGALDDRADELMAHCAPRGT